MVQQARSKRQTILRHHIHPADLKATAHRSEWPFASVACNNNISYRSDGGGSEHIMPQVCRKSECTDETEAAGFHVGLSIGVDRA